ncbi:Arylsulfatase [hydrothermal vent metagenome]|uniref:Arylsulfatase n=1 Tax=hydrothermal vent metagenome TaxID=652676 RepID=A0A3B1DV42_9ZZZZ
MRGPPHRVAGVYDRGMKNSLLTAVVGMVVCGTGGAACASAQAGDGPEGAWSEGDGRPNIVFILADDHAWQAISAYGSDRNVTPNIDRLAAEGMRFDRAFVTNSICAPSRAVMLTGLYGHMTGVRTNAEALAPGTTTFPGLLHEAGYATAIIGKWHLKSEPEGFDHTEVLVGQGTYYNPVMIRNGEKVEHEGYTTAIITDLSIEWLREGREAGKPFLLMAHHKAPHRNWQPGPAHIGDYDGVVLPEPASLFDDWADNASPARQQEMTIAAHLTERDLKLEAPGGLTEEQRAVWEAAYAEKNEAFAAAGLTGEDLVRWKYQRYAKDYLRCVQSVDDSVGRLLDTLETLGLAENTIVVYTSDQGWFLGEHGWYDKRWMYEESFRTPLLVRWPGVVEAGVASEEMVMNLDFAPTLLEAAGVEVPGRMQGESLVGVLRGETPIDWRQSVYYHYYESTGSHNVAKHEGVRTATHKLIRFYETGEWELYDLVADPEEMQNIYGEAGTEELTERLKAELAYLRAVYAVTD